MLAIWRAAVEQFEQGADFVLATILSVEGSSPRHTGTRFIIRKDGVIVGTIGGGLFEADVQRLAAQALERRKSMRVLFSFKGEGSTSMEMICGGDADVLIQFIDAQDNVQEQIFRKLLDMTISRLTGLFFIEIPPPSADGDEVKTLLIDNENNIIGGFAGANELFSTLPGSRHMKPFQLVDIPGTARQALVESLRPMGIVYIFGAGHVGECVARFAAATDFRVVILDDRSDFASPERIPEADSVVVLDSFENLFEDRVIDEDSYMVIVTRGHAHDKTVVAQALKTKAGYIGMIGSRRKTRITFDELLEEGFTEDDFKRVNTPIGLPIGGQTPQESAISIVAEMIQERNRKDTGGSSVCMG